MNDAPASQSADSHCAVTSVTVQIARALPSVERGSPLPLPAPMTPGASCADLRADEAFTLSPLERRLVPTGICIAIPRGFEGQVRPRSGLAVKYGLTVLNAPGTIDSDYRGEVKVCLINLSDEEVSVERGDRIAQLAVVPVSEVTWNESESLDETLRGTGGFGSTGRR